MAGPVTAYYNEIDPYAAQWIRNLIAAGHIAKGEVDQRSIIDVQPDDLRGYEQCHFFAGIGVWSYSLRRAGWPDDRPVWTGSCPCQPFSAAGKGDEFADERHLWPAWFRLIRERRPVAIFGEQVASKDALAWLDHVSTDMEGEGYAFGAVDTCAAGFGAPHIRQRLYFVAEPNNAKRRADTAGRNECDGANPGRSQGSSDPQGCGATGELGDPSGRGRRERGDEARPGSGGHADGASFMGDTEREGPQGRRLLGATASGDNRGEMSARAPSATNGFWADAEWIACRDGKSRPVEPGSPPLVTGAASRVGRLRAYGNAICAVQAEEFVRAYLP